MRHTSLLSPVTYEYSYLWDKGMRASNEDSLILTDVYSGRRRYILAAVADGVGGLDMGEYASCHVTCALRSAFLDYTASHPAPSLKELKQLLMRTLYRCHIDLIEYGRAHGLRLGTTVSLLCITGRRALYIHTGDSRLYRISGRTTQIGRDHLDTQGRLTRCIGVRGYPGPDTRTVHILRDSVLLLCTDGFYRRAPAELMDKLKGADKDRTDRLLTAISTGNTRRGERDNRTAIALRRSRRRR